MPTPFQEYRTSFVRRAIQRLATLARELSGALAGGDEQLTTQLTYEGQLLSQGLTSVTTLTNRLNDEQRTYIIEKLLGLLADTISAAMPVLTLAPLPPRIRGQRSGSLRITGTLSGTLPVGASLILLRDGRQIARQPAHLGPYSFTDATPGSVYRVELSGTMLYKQAVRALISGVLFGTGPNLAPENYLARLPYLAAGFVGGKARMSFNGQRNRILLAVPTSLGSVSLLTQPNDEDADLTMAFRRRTVTLDFGTDGTDTYEVLQNHADFIGDFTLDAHI